MPSWHVSRLAILAIVIAGAATLANCTRVMFAALNAPSYGGNYQQQTDIPYGTGARQTLDVYVPNGAARRPVVVFWYGGMWVRGAKEWYRFVGAAIANLGYVAVLPDYRLYPQAHSSKFIEDGAQAVKWTREHALELGGDPDAIFLMGHSAGAHLAATLALDPNYLREVGGDTQWIRGWISLSAPYALADRYGYSPFLRSVFREPTDWQLIDHSLAASPPALLIHGITDFFPGDVATMGARLQSAGRYVECYIYEDVTHMDTIAAFSMPLRFKAPSLDDVGEFIERMLADPHISDGTAAGIPCPELEINERLHIVKLAKG